MENLKICGKTVSVLASSVLQPQKIVTAPMLQLAKESAIEAKRRMLKARVQSGQFHLPVSVVKYANSKSRVLTNEEVQALRDSKHRVAEHVRKQIKDKTN